MLDADIRGFFDNMSHEWTVKFVEHRVADRRILRLIQKWLKAGLSEDGQWSETKQGTPQGAVISPLLANVYLRYVFDLWVDVWRRKVAKGEVIVVRYADDLAWLQLKADAVRFVPRRVQRALVLFTLELHPEKTRLIEFGRYAVRDRQQRGEGKPLTTSWALLTTVGNGTRQEPSPCGASWRKREWQRNSSPSRLSFAAECMLVQAKSAHGSERSSTATTNTTQCRATSDKSIPSVSVSIDCGTRLSLAAVNGLAKDGRHSYRCSNGGYLVPTSCIHIPKLASTPSILHKSRMRRRARTDLCGADQR